MASKKRKRNDDTAPTSSDKAKILVLVGLWIGTAIFIAVAHHEKIANQIAAGDYTGASILGACIFLPVFFLGFLYSRFVRVMFIAVLAAIVSLVFGYAAYADLSGGFGVIGNGLISLVAGIGALMAVHDAFTWKG